MTVRCASCGSSREIGEDARREGALTRCPYCDAIEPVIGALGAGSRMEADPAEPGPALPVSSPSVWHVDLPSGVYGPVSLARIIGWIREKRVDWEDLVSRDGGPWLPALEQRLLVEHAGAAPADPASSERHLSAPARRGTSGAPEPPVKKRRPERPAVRTPRGVAVIAGALLVLGLLTLNLPCVIAGAGLFSLRRWGRITALAMLGAIAVALGAGMGWAVLNDRARLAATGAVPLGAIAAGYSYLMRRRVRAYFRPGGALRAGAALTLATAVSAAVAFGGYEVIRRHQELRQIPGNGYGYTILRPNRAWIDLPAPRAAGGDPEADLELVRRDSSARALVFVEDGHGDARSCLGRIAKRVKGTGRNPTVYQAETVYAGGLEGAQVSVSVERDGGRFATLATCFADGGQQYALLATAKERDFERLRPELARLARSFRLDEMDDPLHLDIHTRAAQPAAAAHDEPLSLAAVISRADPAVVTIAAYLPGKERGYGSGSILREDGLIVTNRHVIAAARKITVGIAGHGYRRAQVIAADPLRDLALLKVRARDLPVLHLARRPVSAGDDVIAIGSPMGLAHSVTKGIVSSTRRTRDGVDFLQTDVSINPGNSGGPLLNARGEIVGINTFIIRESERIALTGLNFAVAVSYVRELAADHGFALPEPPPAEPAPGASPLLKQAKSPASDRRRSPAERGPTRAFP
jgi:hypothetical protein